MELAQQEEQAKQQSAGRLQNLAAEASRLEASARQEGEARCAAVQVGLLCLPCLPALPNPLRLHSMSACLLKSSNCTPEAMNSLYM